MTCFFFLISKFLRAMRVCDVCGAFLVSTDTDKRIQAHLEGKQHLGFFTLRQEITRIRQLLKDADRGGNDDRRSRERERDRDRDRERDRDRDKEKSSRSRKRSRSRSRSRDRFGKRNPMVFPCLFVVLNIFSKKTKKKQKQKQRQEGQKVISSSF